MTGRYVNLVHVPQRFNFAGVHIEPFIKHINHRFTGGNTIERFVLITRQSILPVVERMIAWNVFFEYPVFNDTHVSITVS
jgi:hypothetical protein